MARIVLSWICQRCPFCTPTNPWVFVQYKNVDFRRAVSTNHLCFTASKHSAATLCAARDQMSLVLFESGPRGGLFTMFELVCEVCG